MSKKKKLSGCDSKEQDKHIANEIGLSRDLVRGYCRKHGLDGFGEEIARQRKMLILEDATGRKRKYCSMECKRLWDKTHRKAFELKCHTAEKNLSLQVLSILNIAAETAILKIGFGEMKMLKKLPIKFQSLKRLIQYLNGLKNYCLEMKRYRHIGVQSWVILQYAKLKKVARWGLQILYLAQFQHWPPLL